MTEPEQQQQQQRDEQVQPSSSMLTPEQNAQMADFYLTAAGLPEAPPGALEATLSAAVAHGVLAAYQRMTQLLQGMQPPPPQP